MVSAYAICSGGGFTLIDTGLPGNAQQILGDAASGGRQPGYPILFEEPRQGERSLSSPEHPRPLPAAGAEPPSP